MIFESTYLQEIFNLQEKMPSGQYDPKALTKLLKEYREFLSEDNFVSKSLEAADVFYYCVKAVTYGLITEEATKIIIESVVLTINTYKEFDSSSWLYPEDIFNICYSKYKFRSQVGNPKNPDTEFMFAEEYLRSRGYYK